MGRAFQTERQHEQRHRDETQCREPGEQLVFLGYNKTRWWGQWKTGGRVRRRLSHGHTLLALPYQRPLPEPGMTWLPPAVHTAGAGIFSLRLLHPVISGQTSYFFKLAPTGWANRSSWIRVFEKGCWDTKVVSCHARGWDFFSPPLIFGLGPLWRGRGVTCPTHLWFLSHSASPSLTSICWKNSICARCLEYAEDWFTLATWKQPHPIGKVLHKHPRIGHKA